MVPVSEAVPASLMWKEIGATFSVQVQPFELRKSKSVVLFSGRFKNSKRNLISNINLCSRYKEKKDGERLVRIGTGCSSQYIFKYLVMSEYVNTKGQQKSG